MAIVKDRSRQFLNEFSRRLEARMLGAVFHLEGVVKRDISIGQAVRRGGVNKNARELAAPPRTKISGLRVGLAPSQPGQPPHGLTGRLLQPITHSVERAGPVIVGRVGSNVK